MPMPQLIFCISSYSYASNFYVIKSIQLFLSIFFKVWCSVFHTFLV